jgi:hypothetical protein
LSGHPDPDRDRRDKPGYDAMSFAPSTSSEPAGPATTIFLLLASGERAAVRASNTADILMPIDSEAIESSDDLVARGRRSHLRRRRDDLAGVLLDGARETPFRRAGQNVRRTHHHFGFGLFTGRLWRQGLPDAQARLAFGRRDLPRQLVDQSRSEPHVGLELGLVSQEYARGPRLEPMRERAHFLHC